MNDTMAREIDIQSSTIELATPQLRRDIAGLELSASRILAGGCGDSFYAAVALEEVYANAHLNYVAVTAQQLAHYVRFQDGDLVLLVSISGSTLRTIEAAHVARRHGARTLAVTCKRGSALADACDMTITLPYQPLSRQTPHTVDYLMTLLALTLVAERMSDTVFDVLQELPSLVTHTIAEARKVVPAITQDVNFRTKYVFLGAGPHRGTAMYAAAKFHEAGGLVALHEETENFVHGMNYLVEPGDVVSLIAPTDSSTFRAKELVKGLTDLNAVVVGISDIDLGASFHLPLPKSAPLLTPFLESLGSQVLCHTVAHHLSLSLEENRAGRDNGQMCKHVQAKWMQETRIS